jgi:hypothetical protein
MNPAVNPKSVVTDLFGFDGTHTGTERRDRYPFRPGFKKSGTSRAAARSISIYAATKRHDVLTAFVAAGEEGLTPDSCAKTLKLSPFTVRPGCTELVLAGLLVPTGERRQNQSGMTAGVLRASEKGIRIAQGGGDGEE